MFRVLGGDVLAGWVGWMSDTTKAHPTPNLAHALTPKVAKFSGLPHHQRYKIFPFGGGIFIFAMILKKISTKKTPHGIMPQNHIKGGYPT